jgi:hypothetical protein
MEVNNFRGFGIIKGRAAEVCALQAKAEVPARRATNAPGLTDSR